MKITSVRGLRFGGLGTIDDEMVISAGPNGPTAQDFRTLADSTVFAATGMLEQAWGQLSQAAQAGLSQEEVLERKAVLESLGTALQQVHTAAGSAQSQSEIASWNQQAAALLNQVRGELETTVKLNQGALASGGINGLMWGLGVAAVVAATGYYVWRKKSSRRG